MEVSATLPDISIPLAIIGVLIASTLFNYATDYYSTDVKAPWAFTYIKYTPRWLSNAIYAWDAVGLIEESYHKVISIPQSGDEAKVSNFYSLQTRRIS